jgi:RND family efflux transporter MFP subunit
MRVDEKNTIDIGETRASGVAATNANLNGGNSRLLLPRTALLIFAAAALAFAALVYSGIHARVEAEAGLKLATEQNAMPTVSVVYPMANDAAQEIVLPGTTQAFTDTAIYARTSGYVKQWYFDIGAHVREGQLLAVIATPEIDQQLRQAQADLATARANLGLAEITAARWQNLWKTNSVSKQSTDQAVSDLAATQATVASKVANVSRLEALQSFENIYAPFDGVITARNTDVGDLIEADANSPSKELFHMAAIRTLRVYVAVPEVYAAAARVGTTIVLTLDEFPGEIFHGRLVRTSNSIDLRSRTLLTEVDVDNRTRKLLPGAYVFVHLKLPGGHHSIAVPSNALLFRSEGLTVGVVRNHRVDLVPIKIGRDYGSSVEVISGLTPTDAVILNPSDSLTSGTPVRVKAQQAGESGK